MEKTMQPQEATKEPMIELDTGGNPVDVELKAEKEVQVEEQKEDKVNQPKEAVKEVKKEEPKPAKKSDVKKEIAVGSVVLHNDRKLEVLSIRGDFARLSQVDKPHRIFSVSLRKLTLVK